MLSGGIRTLCMIYSRTCLDLYRKDPETSYHNGGLGSKLLCGSRSVPRVEGSVSYTTAVFARPSLCVCKRFVTTHTNTATTHYFCCSPSLRKGEKQHYILIILTLQWHQHVVLKLHLCNIAKRILPVQQYDVLITWIPKLNILSTKKTKV